MTKVVYIAPRFIAVNDTNRKVSITDSENCYDVEPKSQIPIHLSPYHADTVSIKSSSDPEWLAPFDVNTAGIVYVREGLSENQGKIYRVGRVLKSPSLFITFSLTEAWPFVIRNNCPSPIYFNQKVPMKVCVAADS